MHGIATSGQAFTSARARQAAEARAERARVVTDAWRGLMAALGWSTSDAPAACSVQGYPCFVIDDGAWGGNLLVHIRPLEPLPFFAERANCLDGSREPDPLLGAMWRARGRHRAVMVLGSAPALLRHPLDLGLGIWAVCPPPACWERGARYALGVVSWEDGADEEDLPGVPRDHLRKHGLWDAMHVYTLSDQPAEAVEWGVQGPSLQAALDARVAAETERVLRQTGHRLDAAGIAAFRESVRPNLPAINRTLAGLWAQCAARAGALFPG